MLIAVEIATSGGCQTGLLTGGWGGKWLEDKSAVMQRRNQAAERRDCLFMRPGVAGARPLIRRASVMQKNDSTRPDAHQHRLGNYIHAGTRPVARITDQFRGSSPNSAAARASLVQALYGVCK
ncbi:hypothetical protein FDG2_3263 [Candidatus Protofrankia californiensis]|uniref:Uncharacterized protein n=1 Tax=Candidatus Protofrankia californiensis TaxID=1839754 RepID=A0A1C3NZA5_9ACTN|nr:hypothetical protein FDG2_3263 [Candidatus Protofrankia californiensis]